MPVAAYPGANSATGNGVTTSFAYSFRILAEGDLLVTVNGVEKMLTTDYTVTGVGDANGGNVVFGTAPANGAAIVIARDMAYSRTTRDYQRNGSFDEETVDADFDSLVMLIQQIEAITRRAFKAPVEVVADLALTTEQWEARANTVFGFDGLGDLMLYDPSSAVTVAGNITYNPLGAGAIGTTAQGALRTFVHSSQYDTQANFRAARDALSGTLGFGSVEVSCLQAEVGLLLRSEDALPNGGKIGSPALRLEARYDSDAGAGTTDTTLGGNLHFIVEGSGPNGYWAFRGPDGRDILRLFTKMNNAMKLTLNANGGWLSLSQGATGEDADLWNFGSRDFSGDDNALLTIENGALGQAVASFNRTTLTSTFRKVGWSADPASAPDLLLERIAAQTLAQKNGNNDQLFQHYGPNDGYWEKGSASELLVIAAAASTDTAANLLPADSIIEAVVVRTNVNIPTAATYSVGDPTTAGRFATGVNVAAGTRAVGTIHADQTGAAGPRQTAAAKVRITPNAVPGAATGQVRITVFYRKFVPPTS